MSSAKPDTRQLLIGIGNSARGDDALGWLFAGRAEEARDRGQDGALDGAPHSELRGALEVVYRYQLQVEDAELIRGFDVVCFADASRETLHGGCALRPCTGAGGPAFSSHQQSPEAILALCQTLFDTAPQAWVLAIEGRRWGLGEALSEPARQHLESAWQLWSRRFFPGFCTLGKNALP